MSITSLVGNAGQEQADVWAMVALLYHYPATCQPAAPHGQLLPFVPLLLRPLAHCLSSGPSDLCPSA